MKPTELSVFSHRSFSIRSIAGHFLLNVTLLVLVSFAFGEAFIVSSYASQAAETPFERELEEETALLHKGRHRFDGNQRPEVSADDMPRVPRLNVLSGVCRATPEGHRLSNQLLAPLRL